MPLSASKGPLFTNSCLVPGGALGLWVIYQNSVGVLTRQLYQAQLIPLAILAPGCNFRRTACAFPLIKDVSGKKSS